MQPMTTERAPGRLRSSNSRMASTDSARASSMKAQVLTMTTSAASGVSARVYPASKSMAVTFSESTWFLAQPSVVSQTVGAESHVFSL